MASHYGKKVLIAGAGQGIGYVIAKAHAEAGATVVCFDYEPNLDENAAQSITDSGGKALTCASDVAEYAAVARAAVETERQCGMIDILINNAGMSPKTDGRKSAIGAMHPDEWQRVVNINLTDAFNFCQVVSAGIRQCRSGRIVNISSVVGQTYRDFVGAHYTAPNAGLIGLTKHLAEELGACCITVNAVAPSRIETDFIHSVAFDVNESIRLMTLMHRLGQPAEVADAVLFLLPTQHVSLPGRFATSPAAN